MKVREALGKLSVTPFVVSVNVTFEYETQARTSLWPPGHEKPPD